MAGGEERRGRFRSWRAPAATCPVRECGMVLAAEALFARCPDDGAPAVRLAAALRRERARIGMPGYDLMRHWMLIRALGERQAGQGPCRQTPNDKGAARVRGDALG